MRKALLFLTFLATLTSVSAFAERPLPENGVRAKLTGGQPFPIVQLGKKRYNMAPGGLILDEANRKITHGALPDSASVLFTADTNGEISRIWILTAEEQAELARAGKK